MSGAKCATMFAVLASPDWTELFFYPIPLCSCPLCGLPTRGREPCEWCRVKFVSRSIRSAAFLSYTWGHSRSPAYAFKAPGHFPEELRQQILRLFAWMAHKKYRHLADLAFVIGAPPRRSIAWGQGGHLDELLSAVEQANFRVLRN